MRDHDSVPAIRRLTTAEASAGLLLEMRRLLDHAFDGDFSDEDWEHTCGGWHLIVSDGCLVAHAAVVPRVLTVADQPFHTGYVEGVATLGARQGEGLGSLVMVEAGRVVRDEFALGALSTARHTFYERLGWECWRGPTFVRLGSTMIRTEDEDDGVMVLRYGESRDLDLTAPISCQARAGDDW
jgi:aminoglycoside 2'-N-acetyltransferase I